MKKTLLSTILLCISAIVMAQPQGGFGGFQVPKVELPTSQEFKDVNYAGDDQAYHTCDIYLPKKEAEAYPVVIHIYGSAWFSNSSKGMADLGTIVKSLLEAGYAVVCPNHRSSMDAKWPAQIHDIRAVIRFVRGEAKKYKFDTSFIATSGFSSGGHLSSTAATTSGLKQAKVGTVDIDLEGFVGNYLNECSAVDAACDWSGPVDLTAMDCGESMKMGENSPEDVLLNSKLAKEPDKYRSLSATNYVNKNNPPVIIFHGEKDNVVPCCQGKKFFELLQAAGVKSEATFVPEGSHGGPQMYTEENLTKMVNFLNSVRLSKQATSPNGKISAAQKGSGYVINYQGKTVLDIPSVGYAGSKAGNLKFSKKISADYQMLAGKRLLCSNEANEYCADLGNGQLLVMRLYNDGVAFRYELASLNNEALPAEQTTYLISEGTKRWMMQWNEAYEGFFPLSTTYKVKTERESARGHVSPEGYHTRWAYPALLEPSDGVFTLISEANIERQQSASCLYNDGELFKVTPAENDTKVQGTWHSPWRTAIIGSLADVVQSTLITDVSEPCKLADTSWIKPGVVSWIYWAYNHGSNDYNIIRKYVDMAVTLHLPYVLIDAEWDEMKDGKTIEDAVAYAVSKGIKPMIWYNSSVGWIDGAPTPKFRLNKPEDREKEFAWCEKIGVAGVKIDFFSGDSFLNMDFCLDLLESAAKHHLLVNFHGATIPRGWQRTYPNLMSTEGVYGAEWYNNLPVFTNRAARHNATLPFTRNVIGPMDYTPCTFSDSQHPHITSKAHELALTVLYESALQHLADKPESYLAQPAKVQKFFGELPSVWDETRLLSGYPGESVVMARRSGNTWYIAGINGRDEAQTLDVTGIDIKGKMILFADTADGKWSITSPKTVPSKLVCQPRGGFVLVVRQ